MRGRGGYAGVIGIVILLIVMVFLARFAIPKPPIKIKNYSLNPTSIRSGKHAVISLIIKNVDLQTHEVSLYFEVNPRVTIYAGAEQLLPKSDSKYSYTFTLNAENPSEDRVFTVTGTLEQGISRVEYPIKLEVIVDGKRIDKNWNDITLIVKK